MAVALRVMVVAMLVIVFVDDGSLVGVHVAVGVFVDATGWQLTVS